MYYNPLYANPSLTPGALDRKEEIHERGFDIEVSLKNTLSRAGDDPENIRDGFPIPTASLLQQERRLIPIDEKSSILAHDVPVSQA